MDNEVDLCAHRNCWGLLSITFVQVSGLLLI